MKNATQLCCALLLCSSCLKRAPTSYELDKRAGMGTPPAEPVHERGGKKAQRRSAAFEEPLQTSSTIAPASRMPARIEPVIRKVWVSDQQLPDGSWLQGTWLFMEVQPARWLFEVDPGGGVFVEPRQQP